MKIKQRTKTVYNFHKDNKKDIFIALLTNYFYATFMVGVPVAIYVGYWYLTLLALLGAYTMLTIVINRPRYETIYGKILMIISCTAGGMTSYFIGEIIKSIFK